MSKTAQQYLTDQAEAVGAAPRGDDLLSDTITDEEIAQAYGVHPSTVRRWAQLGKLPPKVGPSLKPRRNREAVRAMLSGLPLKAAS